VHADGLPNDLCPSRPCGGPEKKIFRPKVFSGFACAIRRSNGVSDDSGSQHLSDFYQSRAFGQDVLFVTKV
jgi:hypothetical protein